MRRLIIAAITMALASQSPVLARARMDLKGKVESTEERDQELLKVEDALKGLDQSLSTLMDSLSEKGQTLVHLPAGKYLALLPIPDGTYEMTSVDTTIMSVDNYLRLARESLFHLRDRLNVLGDPVWKARAQYFAQVESLLDDLLHQRGLSKPLSAEITTGAAVSTTNSDSRTVEQLSEVATAPAVLLQWQTAPWGRYISEPYDWGLSLGGTFGFLPAIALIAPNSDRSAIGDTAAVYRQGFQWDISCLLSHGMASQSEAMLAIRFGQTLLDGGGILGDDGTTILLGVPKSVGRAATFVEADAVFRLFESPLWRIIGEQSALCPALELGIGYRHDNRLGSLSLSNFDVSEERVRLWLTMNGLRVMDRRAPDEPARTFGLNLGVRYEADLKHSRGGIEGLQFQLSGDANLVRILGGRSDAR